MTLAAAVAAVLAIGGCSDDGGSASDDRSAATPSPTPTPTSGGGSPTPSPSSSPSPTPTVSGVEDLAGGWMPADSDHGAVYNLLIDEKGDADSVGSPGPYSALDEDKVCFGSIEDENDGHFRVELDCNSLDDLTGPQDSYRGTATVEASPESAGSMWEILGCDEGPGVLLITWADGYQDALCRTGDSDTTSDTES
ncbi:hypothetical protein [Streptomyces sp. 6N223]|uniref:hypothetical protein n=1 Tax=Streptomyces sp. 6N223 TaxID=3457412 RepID=UPI003FD28A85